MKTKTISLILAITLIACTQKIPEVDCLETLNQTPYIARQHKTLSKDSVEIDFEILRHCGKLDSIDNFLLDGPFIGQIMIYLISKETPITYNELLKKINEYKKSQDYLKIKDQIIVSRTLENKIISIEEFEKDKLLLLKIGMTESELKDFKDFIESNQSQKMTYKEAFAKYLPTKQSTSNSSPDIVEFENLIDIETAMNNGKEKNKNVLLYFSCYSCVNARKIENIILMDPEIKSLITQNFLYYIAYSDDKSQDKVNNSTVGRKFIEMQTKYFKTNYQPYFCIIDNNGKILSEIGYTNKTEEFIKFLYKGLK